MKRSDKYPLYLCSYNILCIMHVPLIYLSEKRLHLQRPGYWVAGMDLVEGLKDLISWCTGSHHIWSLRRGEERRGVERRDNMLQTTCIHSHALPGGVSLIKYVS